MSNLEFIQPPSTNIEARNIACDLELSIEKEKPVDLRVFRIIQELKDRGLLESEVSRVKKLFGEELKSWVMNSGKDVGRC